MYQDLWSVKGAVNWFRLSEVQFDDLQLVSIVCEFAIEFCKLWIVLEMINCAPHSVATSEQEIAHMGADIAGYVSYGNIYLREILHY